ncbi:hypothetical protein AGMMS49545_08850 [Betaproteobacteria bacterium]|nr:hypothetical protein AGMMS49545_08850 [Betaproteobacteria bacterium]GHU43924.1 hypothetical protein AGMMS50289_11190 [Betaproteobacteria bacterium]
MHWMDMFVTVPHAQFLRTWLDRYQEVLKGPSLGQDHLVVENLRSP